MPPQLCAAAQRREHTTKCRPSACQTGGVSSSSFSQASHEAIVVYGPELSTRRSRMSRSKLLW
jgi:hypothetical protein